MCWSRGNIENVVEMNKLKERISCESEENDSREATVEKRVGKGGVSMGFGEQGGNFRKETKEKEFDVSFGVSRRHEYVVR